ncbi:hypothetical protein ABV409_00620 [Flagellimonas sp. DF-77]|uniref:hypothetical protein n=1 Tax=Flagellimonas algarum TaxID=3230298 RepID=UPI0033934684
MRKKTRAFIAIILLITSVPLLAQKDYNDRITVLKEQKERITQQEKDALKLEVKSINERLERGAISTEEAAILKEEAAKKRALNIENRLAIIENQIALLDRNEGKTLVLLEADTISDDDIRLNLMVDGRPFFSVNSKKWKKEIKYDRRTYSDFVIAIGLNNAIIEDQSLDDSPYKIGGSRFFEMGWQWRTRVFRNSNFLRLNYGFNFQFNGLKPDNNQYFVTNGDQTELQEFEFELNKSKFRMDNLVFPLHFEFGSSKFYEGKDRIRYSLDRQFRLGIGGYGGFNIGTRQKLKYTNNGDRIKDKLKRDYNTSDLIYGLSAYAGVGGTLLYVKYDLNPIFRDAPVKQRNISLGLRFDL